MSKSLVLIFSAVLIFSGPSNTHAQFWKKLKKHVEKKVEREAENRANRKADQAVDKVFDSAEKGAEDAVTGEGKSGEKKTKAKEDNQDKENSNETNTDNNAETSNKKKIQKTNIVWSKYDFVPGDQVIFEDAPSADEENGEFPSRWDLYKGNVEIGEVNGENVIMFLSRSSYIVPYLKNSNEDYLPDVFTLELDIWFSKGSSTANRLWIYLGDQKNNNRADAAHKSLIVMPHSLEFGESEKSYPGTENVGWTVEKEGSWKHIAIAYTKGKFKAYFNDTRLINIPHLEVNPSGITIEASNDNMYIKNIRIAKGGVKYYDRVLTDGKIIVNGIKFDVDKATLKPESMGPINKIYKLMKKKKDLKFSVEGHTDSDGDEAHNLELSKRRAKTVMDKLISMGISPDRLKYTGFGESKPLATNATPEGKANNRRVEFVKF